MDFCDTVIITQCPDCQVQFSTTQALQLHYEEQHWKIKLEPDEFHDDHQIQSPILGFPRGIKRKLKTENETPSVIEDKLLACQNCSYVSKTEHALQKHIQTQHNPYRTVYCCHYCDYFCLQERTFQLHKLKHSEPDAKFACDQCGKLFRSMGIMKRHSLTHNKQKSFICNIDGCKKSFNIKSRLTDHIRYVHNKSRSHGKSQSKRISLLKNHDILLESYSSRNKNSFNHQEKNRKYTKLQNLNKDGKEMKVEGSGSCTEVRIKDPCPTFSSENGNVLPLSSKGVTGNLQVKEETHSDVITVYDIVLPDKDIDNFSKKADISTTTLNPQPSETDFISKNSRYLRKNNKVSRFVCSWSGCGKSFRDGYNLRMHICTHTREMQRACKVCGYTCVQKSALDKHMLVHEKRNEFFTSRLKLKDMD